MIQGQKLSIEKRVFDQCPKALVRLRSNFVFQSHELNFTDFDPFNLQPAPGPYDHSVDEREHTVEQWKELIYQEVVDYEGRNHVEQEQPR